MDRQAVSTGDAPPAIGPYSQAIVFRDVADFATINEIYAAHMPDPPPARSAPAGVQLPHGLLISIEAIATVTPS
jgi:2-iminobutanoate/2-iminopropanoate deaminase